MNIKDIFNKDDIRNIYNQNRLIIYITIAYFILSSTWLIGLYDSFLTTGDLGHYIQMFRNTVDGNGIFTTDLRVRPGNPTGFYLWEHFAISLFAFVPIYYIFPYPETLLILKTLFISISIPVLWLLARKFLSEKLSLIIIISYILNPFLIRALSFNFQEQIVLPVIIFAQFYFYFNNNYRLFILFSIFGLLVSEYAPLLMVSSFIGLAISEYILSPKDIDNNKEKDIDNIGVKNVGNDKKILLLSVSLISVLYYIVVTSIMHYNAETGVVIDDPSKRVDIIGYIISLIFNGKLLDIILLDFKNRILYLNMSMMPVFYTALLSPISILPLITYIGAGWLSDNKSIYEFDVHHPLYILPYLYIGYILIARRSDFEKLHENQKKLIFRLAIIVSISLFMFQVADFIDRDYYPSIDEHNQRLHQILDMIPNGASVLAQGNIQPNIADRTRTFNGVPDRYYSYLDTKGFIDFRYIIYDKKNKAYNYWNYDRFKPLLDRIIDTKEYGIWIYSDNIFVLERGYNGSILKIGEDKVYTGKDLDSYSGHKISNDVLMHSRGVNEATFWFGPYKFLTPGKYRLTYEIKRDGLYKENESNENLITLDITKNKAKDLIMYKNLKFPDVGTEWTNVTIIFQINDMIDDAEFRGMNPSYKDNIYLRKIKLEDLE